MRDNRKDLIIKNDLFLYYRNNITEIVPRTDTDHLRQMIQSIDRAQLIAACDHEYLFVFEPGERYDFIKSIYFFFAGHIAITDSCLCKKPAGKIIGKIIR